MKKNNTWNIRCFVVWPINPAYYIEDWLILDLSDLYTEVHLKGTKKFGSKVINRQFS